MISDLSFSSRNLAKAINGHDLLIIRRLLEKQLIQIGLQAFPGFSRLPKQTPSESASLAFTPPRFRVIPRVSSCQDCEHSVIQLTRPVKLRRTPMRSRQSLRASIIYKGPVQLVSQQAAEAPPSSADPEPPEATRREQPAESVDGEEPHTNPPEGEGRHPEHALLFKLFMLLSGYFIIVIKGKFSLNPRKHFRSGDTRLASHWTVQSSVQLHTRTQWRACV